MTCGYCEFSNANDEHRCVRCGRRLSSMPVLTTRAAGANALAPEVMAAELAMPRPARTVAFQAAHPKTLAPKTLAMDEATTLDALPRSRAAGFQPSLFGTELQPKIIPFDIRPRTAAPPAPPAAVPANTPRSARKPRVLDEAQAKLDFLPPAKSVSKTLKTRAEAVIYCDAVAAAPIHRTTAAVLDAAMVLLGFGIIVAIFQFVAKPVGLDRNAFVMLGGMLTLTAMFYSLLFAIAGELTPGLRWTELRLINFDGFPPDARSRALRLAGGWLSILSGGLGLVWALLDEEGLTWHDHMSKTFPTLRESTSIIVRHHVR